MESAKVRLVFTSKASRSALAATFTLASARSDRVGMRARLSGKLEDEVPALGAQRRARLGSGRFGDREVEVARRVDARADPRAVRGVAEEQRALLPGRQHGAGPADPARRAPAIAGEAGQQQPVIV